MVAVRPSAAAAWRVTPASASSGVVRKREQARWTAISSEAHGDEPGLQLVATAMRTAWARKASMGGRF